MSILTTATRMWFTRSTKPFIFTNEYDDHLPFEQAKSLGLYVHIPFCKTICHFCPYCKVTYQKELVSEYISSLIKEIHLVGGSSTNTKQSTSLYFGGGSPALVIEWLSEILSALNDHFIITEGIGIELHPHDVTIPILTHLKKIGITKISIGVQSFQDEFLHILGREKTAYQSMFDALEKVHFETVSMDFIFALPGQNFQLLKRDIDIAFQNGANHIAIYPFIDFSFADSGILKMAEKEKRKLLDDITNYCISQDYVRDSIWTFGKADVKKYSSMTRENFLGFGCSATTLLTKQFKINTFSLKEYIARTKENKLPTSLTLRFTLHQRMIYYLFWTAYTTKVHSEEFKDFFGLSLEKVYGIELLFAKLFGFLTKTNSGYAMTLKGAYYYHYFENYYTLSYIDKMWGILRKNAFPDKIQF